MRASSRYANREPRAFLAGRFPYDAVAVVSDRGRGRKERIAPRAFEFAVSGAGAARPLELLAGLPLIARSHLVRLARSSSKIQRRR